MSLEAIAHSNDPSVKGHHRPFINERQLLLLRRIESTVIYRPIRTSERQGLTREAITVIVRVSIACNSQAPRVARQKDVARLIVDYVKGDIPKNVRPLCYAGC